MSRYGVFFAETRILFARTGFSPFYLLFLIVGITSSFLIFLYILAMEPYDPMSNFVFGLIIVGIINFPIMRAWVWHSLSKFSKFGKLPPETIMVADKKNFQIPYDDILRVEIKKGSSLRLARIIIQTAKEKYEFNLIEKKEYNAQINLVRRFLPEKTYVV